LVGWTSHRQGADDEAQALAVLQDAVKTGPVLAGPAEMGLFRHQPEMTGPIGADHFVCVLEADDKLIRFHDPQDSPYATLPAGDFLAAPRADTIAYKAARFTMRSDFLRFRDVTTETALHAALPGAIAWLRGGDDLAVPLGRAAGMARRQPPVRHRDRGQRNRRRDAAAARPDLRRTRRRAGLLSYRRSQVDQPEE